MKIVPATVENAPGIAGVHVRSWQAAYAGILDAEFLQGMSIDSRAQQWHGNLQRNESQTLMAQRDDAVLGFVSYGRCRDEDAPADLGEIWALYADPSAWGQGVGLAVTRRAVAELKALGRTSTSRWVLGQNQRGIRFYQAFGFTPVPGSAKHFERRPPGRGSLSADATRVPAGRHHRVKLDGGERVADFVVSPRSAMPGRRGRRLSACCGHCRQPARWR